MAELPTGTVTFLFTDVEGSTRLLDELGSKAYAEAIAQHRRLIRTSSGAHGGVEVDTQGDSFFIAFARASDAVTAAETAQRDLADGPVRVRMGLHTGEPLRTEEGYVGPDVHKAARIAAAGHGGQVLVSTLDLRAPGRPAQGSRRASAEGSERAGASLSTRRRRVSATQVVVPDELAPSGDPVPRARARAAGRGRIAWSRGRAPADAHRAGGSREDTTCASVRRRGSDSFPDGVRWVSLAEVRDPSFVLAAVAQALEVAEEAARSLADVLASGARGKARARTARQRRALASGCRGRHRPASRHRGTSGARHQPGATTASRRARVRRAGSGAR